MHSWVSIQALRMAMALTLLVWLGLPLPGQADTLEAEAAYQNQCAACHIAFPPKKLSAGAWKKIMGQLESHFGVNASMDPSSQQVIADYLAKNAGRSFWSDEIPPNNRMTQTRWFLRKHGGIPAEVWGRDAVRSASHCAACHPEAGQSYFGDDTVRIPR